MSATIGAIVARTPVMGPRTELIFVEGNSTDGTAAEIEAVMAWYAGPLGLRLVRQGAGRGKGDAVRKGFAAAAGVVFWRGVSMYRYGLRRKDL